MAIKFFIEINSDTGDVSLRVPTGLNLVRQRNVPKSPKEKLYKPF